MDPSRSRSIVFLRPGRGAVADPVNSVLALSCLARVIFGTRFGHAGTREGADKDRLDTAPNAPLHAHERRLRLSSMEFLSRYDDRTGQGGEKARSLCETGHNQVPKSHRTNSTRQSCNLETCHRMNGARIIQYTGRKYVK